MKLRLSIFGRTFLLTVAALAVTEAVGLTLYSSQPVQNAQYLSVADVARVLAAMARTANAPGPALPGPGPEVNDRGPVLREAPPIGPPPDDRYEELENVHRDWISQTANAPPTEPTNTDRETSARFTGLLAVRIGDRIDNVRFFIPSRPLLALDISSDDDNDRLKHGFVAAWHRPDGTWHIVRATPPFIDPALSRRALILSTFGLILLLPLSWIFARALSRPIIRFAEAARRLGTDPYAPPLERDGPSEMLVAIDSFNAMQGRLTRLLKERTQMVGAIAHDLRTPLMRLAFRLDGIPAENKERIETDLQEMKLMISSALDFVRDQSLGGARERLDFRLLVESVVDDERDLGHDVTLQRGEPVTLNGDPGALRRAIGNLVENAIKYGERARLRLRSTTDSCTLEIDDDGPGIPETLQERVFEPFFRTEASRNRDTGGMGLGLTIVRGIVLDHGGSIALRNRKDGGLRVVVSLAMPNP